jgi:hypothetical protein
MDKLKSYYSKIPNIDLKSIKANLNAKSFKEQLKNIDANFASNIVIGMIALLLLILIIHYWILRPTISSECSSLSKIYSNIQTNIKSLNENDPNCKYFLRDYYTYTAYNCCGIGSYKDNYVDVCALKQLLLMGVRGLDFEVYSIDNQPVVAISTSPSNFVKETYNSIPFSQIMYVLSSNAFSSGTCVNPDDPLIMHLRIKSTNTTMYQNLANIFKQYDNLFLGPEYSYESHGKNLGIVPLLKLRKKIVLIVDKMNNSFMDCKDFYEYVNLTSNSIFMHALPFNNVKNTPDLVELQDYNKSNMTIVFPDNIGANPVNPNLATCLATGCQMIGMMFQFYDSNLQAYIQTFNSAGYAFSLKPENLRLVPVTIPAPTPQNPSVSYQTRTITSDYYNFNI